MTPQGTQLVITRGLPAAGKTTWARQWVADATRRVRVNRDDLRHNLFGLYWGLTHRQEDEVTAAQRAAVRALLEQGVSVVVDDTNLRLAHAKEWAKLADELGADFDVVDFPVDPGECVDRDSDRRERGERSVGDTVIWNLADRYGLRKRWLDPVDVVPTSGTPRRLYSPDGSLPTCWLVDLDGTLAHMKERGPFEWGRVGEDDLDLRILGVVEDLRKSGSEIVVLSGRDAVCREQTVSWLNRNGVPFDELLMRPAGDVRKDAIVKEELFWAEVASNWHVLGVLDDRDQVVAMWRSLGLLCLQVAPGAF